MSANLVVPFNFQPSSVSVKTASYTIPAGKYARVVVNLEGSATFTIGGVTALRGTQNSVLASTNLAVRHTTASPTLKALYPAPGSNLVDTADGAFNSTTDQKTIIADIWVPASTVISGTGTWRAVVTEYNEIT